MDISAFTIHKQIFLYSLERSTAGHRNCWQEGLHSVPKDTSGTLHYRERGCKLYNVRIVEFRAGQDRPSFRTDSAKCHFLLSSGRNKVPYQINCRFRVPLLHLAQYPEKLDHMFLHTISRVHYIQQQNYAQQVAFCQSCMDDVASDLDSYVR